jgi:8-oxo-dGTP pyrophosphatase MutT (NUDIX family)
MIDPRPIVAIAILHQGSRFLMQLRDNIPTIRYPGYWALFGGHLEPDEHPDQAVQRELQEEIGYTPVLLTPFGVYADDQVVRHVYHGQLSIPLNALQLNEGWDMDLLTISEIQQGDRYSKRAEQVRPVGPVHQQILLDFMRDYSFIQI